MPELNRTDLFQKKAKVNQIRNGVYSFISYFRKDLNKSADDTRKIIQNMGKNIAKSFFNYWKPENTEPLRIIREIYRTVFSGSVNVREKDGYIVVIDRNCPFCKYTRDVDISGCELILGFITQYFDLLSSKKYIDPATGTEMNIPKLEGKITASKIFSEKNFCQTVYKKI